MRPTRRTQPYRKGRPRKPGPTLGAMLRGEPVNRPHPLNARRKLQKNRKQIQATVRRSRHNRA